MRYQEHKPSKFISAPIIVDEDDGIPITLIEEYRTHSESGPTGPADPRSILVSMSEHSKAPSYDVFEYHPATRADQAADYAPFAPAHPQYATEYVVTAHSQATLGVPQQAGLSYLPSVQNAYVNSPHDPTAYYAAAAAAAGHPPAYTTTPSAYLDTNPRQLPEILSFSPAQGIYGTKVSITFQCIYDLQAHPQSTIVVMFGHKRCDSVLSRTSLPTSPYQYVIQANAPPLSTTGSTPDSPSVSLALGFEGPVPWQSPTLDVGTFTYSGDYEFTTPIANPRKRRLSFDAEDRDSPSKKQAYSQLTALPAQPYYAPDTAPLSTVSSGQRLSQSSSAASHRRYSQPDYGMVQQSLPRVQTPQYYSSGPASATARLQTASSPANYGYHTGMPSVLRSPITTVIPATRTSQLPSTASSSGNPPLIRTSTIQQSPSTPGVPHSTTQSFNPYAMYPANSKAMLKIEGDLNSMVENWTEAEWDVRRRLVQFQRSQQGSVISTTFEATSPADRLPNSICVSCIWWEEKGECYVTSVDTIQLLESLVAVRFTVEEKNRIRRNLEGFRPATVSKTKADSEDFFKLIMGFPNPKPRNIEKDVKVFPWRILSTALKKIIGKYSASYSSTAGALHAAPVASTYLAARVTDAGGYIASPRSTSSSSTSHGHTYATAAINAQAFLPATNVMSRSHADMATGPPDLHLAVPQQTMTAWHGPARTPQGSATTTPGLSASTPNVRTPASWNYSLGMGGYGSMTSGLPDAPPPTPGQYQFGAMRMPPQAGHVPEARFVPLHDDYEQHHQQTSAPP